MRSRKWNCSPRIFVEPRNRSFQNVLLVLGFTNRVTFRQDRSRAVSLTPSVLIVEFVPKFIGLRCGTFRISITSKDQCRGLNVLDIRDRELLAYAPGSS